ncbi:PEPxxWA-CTERM sorting domain-containing protein [Sphingomonas sp. GB1N7]|uniref:PEPxxWA-CTERM sorting domain-containing protein n=1 Tax=Parasphingomonas caseinilytica TaxID=3096158 RepID=UPI002FC75699
MATTYVNEAAFLAAAGTPLTLESFEATPNVTGAPVVFAGGTVTCTGTNYCSSFSGTRQIGNATNGNVTAYFASPDRITFTFSTAITSFGIDVIDLGTAGATNFSLTYAGGTTTLFSNYTGGGTLFAGLVDANGFTSVSFTGTANGDGIDFDRLRYGTAVAAVPETATWGMMILGFGMIGAASRSHKVKTTVAYA